MYNPFSITGKKILVTGASSGIGRATAIECAKLGAQVLLTARNEERLKETFGLLEGEGHKMVIADLTKPEDTNNLLLHVEMLDGAVLSAGINDKSLIKFISEEHINKMLSTNLIAPIQLTQQLVKKKKFNKEASIVFISSISSFFPSVSNAMYASTKSALSQFAKVLALEVMPTKIRVNCIAPAFVETGMLNKYEVTDKMDEIRKNAPFGRFLTPEEVAQASIYLLSDAAKLITGSELVMDGGFLIKR